MNYRDAINEVLLALNELPIDVSDTIEDIPTALLVSKEIEIARRKVLSYGWEFNTLNLSFYPNDDNNIVISSDYLQINSTDNENLIVRDWKLFDKDANSFKFYSPVGLTVTDNVVFDDLPFAVANLVVQTASLKAYIDIVGNTEDVKIRKDELKEARIEAIRYDTQISNTNMLTDDYSINLLDMSSI